MLVDEREQSSEEEESVHVKKTPPFHVSIVDFIRWCKDVTKERKIYNHRHILQRKCILYVFHTIISIVNQSNRTIRV